MNTSRVLPAVQTVKEVRHEWARIFFRSDDIVEVHLLPGFFNDKKVLGVIDLIKSHSKEQRVLVLTVTNRRSMVTPSGLKAVFSKPAVNYSMAKAYLFQTRTQFFLARLGRWLYQPKTPIRFFREKQAAETWLKSFLGCNI